MRTAIETEEYIANFIHSMCKCPRMYAHDAMSLEAQFLTLMNMSAFIRHNDKPSFVCSEWMKFAHNEIGFSGNNTVSVWLQKHGRLDDEWDALTELMLKFKIHMEKTLCS